MAARLITGRRKFDHITPVLRELHWLPIKERIEYKLSSLISKCMHDQASKYQRFLHSGINCIRLSEIETCCRLKTACSACDDKYGKAIVWCLGSNHLEQSF